VVFGPTASGKSEVSDALAEGLTQAHRDWVPTLVVDSMQVYREIPTITNQARRRPAELVGIVSVTEEWTVARHKARAEEVIGGSNTPFVLDAGTGMYLNAIILDVPLAPQVDAKMRQLAEWITADALNPRRAARAKELELAGTRDRGSIWDGEPRYDTAMIYLRPHREALDGAIAKRSERIVSGGLEEAAKIREMAEAGAGITASVLDSIGVRELMQHLSGDLTLEEAQKSITERTRRLARRQMRWFDKLARILKGRAEIKVAESPPEPHLLHCMHDKMKA
jgi:tRNA dimethylallyltransferase